METSEQLNELAAALAKAQGEIRNPGKDKTATVEMKSGGKYSYNYGDLAGLLDAIRKPFADNGLCYVQAATNEPGCVHVTTRIIHSSGQWIEETLTMPVGEAKPQALGSAITYARRYAIGSLAGVASEQDDDGAAAQEAASNAPSRGNQKPRQDKPAAAAAPPPAGADLYVGNEPQREVLRARFSTITDINNEDKHAIAAAMKGKKMAELDQVIELHFGAKGAFANADSN